MSDILHDFFIRSTPDRVFAGCTTPAGLDAWWTLKSTGEPEYGTAYQLFFGPEYDWRARVTRCVPNTSFTLEITDALPDWVGSRVEFDLAEVSGGTQVRFAHRGWHEESEHFRISTYCWAMYLRLLRRNIEFGELVEYSRRLDV